MHLEEMLQQRLVDVSSFSLPDYQRAGEKHPIYLLRIPATQALTYWETLRSLVPETGYWPVIGWDRFQQPPWEEEPVQDILEAGLHVNVQQWFDQQWLERYGKNAARWEDRAKQGADQASTPFAFHLHLGRFPWTPSPLAPIALVPTTDFWEVPAYLSVQANEWDPRDAVQVALLKYWHERWKAELVSMVSGLMEMRVLQPPTNLHEALELAKEQYLYAPDVVD